MALRPALVSGLPGWPWVLLLVAAGALGAPLFAVLGGLAIFLFMAAGIPPPTVVGSAYDLTTHPTLPAVPLFTLAGFLLAEGDTPARLLRVFRALFGWMPGGTAIACVVVSAFFTIFTGGSGVTILALGGLLLPALLKDGYPDRFSVGLLTASGSLGLLLPPALPLILYAIVAEISVAEMLAGGVLPGLLLIGLAAAHGIHRGRLAGVARTSFEPREAAAAVWHGKWEVLLPLVVLAAFFGGYATIVETSAITVVYAFAIQVVIHGNVRVEKLRRVFAECVTTIGGVLIILAVARGFSSYLVDAAIPAALIEWTRAHVENKYVFLLGLNLFLLIVGCLMDIFSALFVVVPLVAPIGAEFGIHPVHLGIIFIANLELGYLTPPVGLNLFLASYRFDRPLLDVYRASTAMLIILGIGVLLITYVPWLTTGLLPFVSK
jgi:tripartite ATP-independent transporter DctM subunit